MSVVHLIVIPAASNRMQDQHGFSSAPVEPGWSAGHFVVGVPKGEEARLPEVKAMVEQLSAEDGPVLRTIRFRRGLLTASDRHLARYFRYVEGFPTFMPPAG